MKPINTSLYDFPRIIEGGYLTIARCRERNYAARFVGESRPVYYVGVNYDPAARTVSEVKAEPAIEG